MWTALVLLVATPVALLAVPGEDLGERVEIQEEGWPLPDRESAVRQGKRFLDVTPLIEGEETKAVAFVGTDYPLFVIWSIDGEPYAIICDENGRGPFEFGLWDMDGDGKFETKTGAYRMIQAPRWVVDKFFHRRGLKPPSPDGPPGDAGDPESAGNSKPGKESPPASD
ncbi:MAG: hypothetical protein V3T54_08070 [Acidobacteriota bacterium]